MLNRPAIPRGTRQGRVPASFLAALVLLVACSPFAQAPTPTATPAPTDTPAPTVTPSVTPSPTVTPTIAPDLLLQAAEKVLQDGEVARGVFALESLLAQTPAASQAADAALLLGQEWLREGQNDAAIDVLTRYLELQPTAERDARAWFWRAEAQVGLENWQDAIVDFTAWMQLQPGVIDSYALERIGDAQQALGQPEAALTSYRAAAASERVLPASLRMIEKLAEALLAAGLASEAVTQYEIILTRAENAGYRAGIRLAAARAQLAAGDEALALARMKVLFEEQPDTAAAYEAMLILLEREIALEPADIGRVSSSAGDVQRTQAALAPLAAAGGDFPAELWLTLGRAERDLGASEAATAAFAAIPQDSDFYGQALLELGRTRFWSGDTEGAIEHYLQLADRMARSPAAAEALWRAGFLQGSLNLPLEARATFEALVEEFPDTAQATSALWLMADAAELRNETALAREHLTRLANRLRGEGRAEALLRSGRLSRLLGNEEAAKAAWNDVGPAAPDSFFAARAKDLLSSRSPLQPPSDLPLVFDEANELVEAEDWLRATFDLEQAGPLWPAAAELLADGRIRRGTALWSLGLIDEARDEFFHLINESSGEGLTSYQLAVHLRGLGDYYSSIFAAANVLKAADVATVDAPRWLARLRYPVYWLDLVLVAAREHGMDPLLLFSLIRLESLFDPWAEAAAGEKGLMQVIPPTGDYIAGQINWPDYQHSDLFRPQASITFGAWYLAEQLQRFNLNPLVALAGYNAGPGRAIQWQEASGGDADRFLEAIDIDSTRNYVQLLYGIHHVYRTIYGAEGCGMYQGVFSCTG
ncbi:MAG: transglycosylase SLT domain-containing protein [Anaerolineaceae bacterium]|nr:transglycosylase SLT domain-containing protein [Anaerolineaceae bacterium]